MFKFRLTGLKWFSRYLQEAVEEEAMRQQLKAARLVAQSARASMKQAPVIIGPRGGVYYVPSAPGTPPHVRTGNLRRGIRTIPLRRSVVVRMVPYEQPGWYGLVHEFGGRIHPPRPFLRPAFIRMKNRYPELFRNLPLRRSYRDLGKSYFK